MSGIRYQVSGIRYQVSGVRCAGVGDRTGCGHGLNGLPKPRSSLSRPTGRPRPVARKPSSRSGRPASEGQSKKTKAAQQLKVARPGDRAVWRVSQAHGVSARRLRGKTKTKAAQQLKPATAGSRPVARKPAWRLNANNSLPRRSEIYVGACGSKFFFAFTRHAGSAGRPARPQSRPLADLTISL